METEKEQQEEAMKNDDETPEEVETDEVKE